MFRIENEPPEESDVRKELAISKLTNEIKLLKIRYERHYKHFEEVDLEIENMLKSKFEENVSSILCLEWKSVHRKEEETSVYRSEEWFHDLAKVKDHRHRERLQTITTTETTKFLQLGTNKRR